MIWQTIEVFKRRRPTTVVCQTVQVFRQTVQVFTRRRPDNNGLGSNLIVVLKPFTSGPAKLWAKPKVIVVDFKAVPARLNHIKLVLKIYLGNINHPIDSLDPSFHRRGKEIFIMKDHGSTAFTWLCWSNKEDNILLQTLILLFGTLNTFIKN